MCSRCVHRSASNPASYSRVFSGFRFAFPRLESVMPGASVLFVATATGLKNASASVGPGCRPLLPHAARTRSELSHDQRGKNGSSDTTHEPDTLGEVMKLKFAPKAELSS